MQLQRKERYLVMYIDGSFSSVESETMAPVPPFWFAETTKWWKVTEVFAPGDTLHINLNNVLYIREHSREVKKDDSTAL
jgi:hypothetical protein